MAVVDCYGKDASFYGCDITQFTTKEEKDCYRYMYSRGFGDGLILFIPVMCCPWSFGNYPYQDMFFQIHFPIEAGKALGNWEPFYERVSKDYGWRYFTVVLPWNRKKPGEDEFEWRYTRTVFYKKGYMPEEPQSVSESLDNRFGHGNGSRVEQGGILYSDHSLWEGVNRNLAFKENPQPFIKAVQQWKIWV